MFSLNYPGRLHATSSSEMDSVSSFILIVVSEGFEPIVYRLKIYHPKPD